MKQVLIVDDSKPIRERLVALLAESAQIQVVGQAENGREAWAAVRFLKPDIVVLDIRMPGSSGITLLKQIKARVLAAGFSVELVFDKAYVKEVTLDFIPRPRHE